MALTNKKWVPTPEAFEKLLAFLDRDREAAGAAYETIRHKLVKFFQWRNCPFPEEYADRTIDRVTRRVAEGNTVQVDRPYLYFHGVAINVLREQRREPGSVPLSGDFAADEPSQEAELRHQCLDRCLNQLPPESRRLLGAYHQGFARSKIDARKQLADELGVSLNVLRIRIYRIRASLAASVLACCSEMIAKIRH